MNRFMQFSIGVLCLAIATLIGFHVGTRTAQAQVGSVIAGTFSNGFQHYVILPNGDVYQRISEWDANGKQVYVDSKPFTYVGNFWGGQPIGTSPSTLGGVKSQYAPKKP